MTVLGSKAPIVCMTLFKALQSCNSLHLLYFFFMTRIRVIQRLLDDPVSHIYIYICFSTEAALAANSPPWSSHWFTQTSFSDNQMIQKANYPDSCLVASTMATSKKISHGIAHQWPFIITLMIYGNIIPCWVLPTLLMGYIPCEHLMRDSMVPTI